MVQKFLALSKLGQKMGFGAMRVMTDVSAERYWTVVSEMEVKSLEEYTEMSRKSMENKEFQEAMKAITISSLMAGARSTCLKPELSIEQPSPEGEGCWVD